MGLESVHLFAERGDVPARFDDALAPVVVLVQLVAEGLEDGLDGAGWRSGAHGVVGFGMQRQWLPFPGSFGAHEDVEEGSLSWRAVAIR